MHVTTLSRSQKVYRTLVDFAAEIIRSFKLDLDWFDIGGGFYGGGPAKVGAYDGVRAHHSRGHRATSATQPIPSSSSSRVEPWCARRATTLVALSM